MREHHEREPANKVNALERGRNWSQIIANAISVLGLSVAVITLICFYSQFKEMRIQTHVLSTQSRQDQRAWLVMKTVFPPKIVEGQKIFANADIKNIGKTSARKLVAMTVLVKLDADKSPTFDYSKGLSDEAGIMIPNDDHPFPVTMVTANLNSKKLEFPTYSRSDAEDLNAGRAYLVVYSQIKYRDVFDVPHWVKYCGWKGYGRDKEYEYAAQQCANYNDVDNNVDVGNGDSP